MNAAALVAAAPRGARARVRPGTTTIPTPITAAGTNTLAVTTDRSGNVLAFRLTRGSTP